MGRFLGLKLHFVISHKGQVMAWKITPGNRPDGTVLEEMTQHLAGKGCIAKLKMPHDSRCDVLW